MKHAIVAGVAAAWLATGINLSAQAKPAAPKPAAAKPAATAKSPKDKMPPAVKAAFEKAYPNAIVKNVAKEVEKGVATYEVETTDGGMTRDIIYTPDGKVVEFEEGMAESDLPPAVRSAVTAKYPKGKIAVAEKLTRGSTILYEVQVTDGGKKHSLELDANGKPEAPVKPAPKKR